MSQEKLFQHKKSSLTLSSSAAKRWVINDFDRVMSRISEKENHFYTGMLKFGFQDGELVSYVESDFIDPCFIVEGMERDYLVLKIEQLCKPWQNGSVVMAFREGKLIGGSHVSTWKGKTLSEYKKRWKCKSVVNAESQ